MITPAQRMLLEAAQEKIDRLTNTIKRHEADLIYFERELNRARGTIKSLEREIAQNGSER